MISSEKSCPVTPASASYQFFFSKYQKISLIFNRVKNSVIFKFFSFLDWKFSRFKRSYASRNNYVWSNKNKDYLNDLPSVNDGIDILKAIKASLKSNEKKGMWVDF